jgi:hypothetical protein
MKTTSCCRTTPGHPRTSGAKRVFRQVFWLVPVFFPSRPALIFWFLLKSHRLNLYMKDKQPKQLFSQKLSAGQWIPKKHSRNSQRRDRPGFAPVFPFKARRPPEVTKADKSSSPKTSKSPLDKTTSIRKKLFIRYHRGKSVATKIINRDINSLKKQGA